jgi:hypothetical protein
MSRSFIREGKPPAARSHGVALGIAPICDRSRSGNHDYPGPRAEGRVQRDDHIADNFNLTGDCFRQYFSDSLRHFWTCGSGNSHASPIYLRRINSGGVTRLADSIQQCLARPCFSYS